MLVKLLTVACFTIGFRVIGAAFGIDHARALVFMGHGVTLFTAIGFVVGVFVASQLRK